MVDANKSKRAKALKEEKPLCKEFGIISEMLKSSLEEGLS